MKRILASRADDWRCAASVLAVAIYGLFGAPTPTGFGWSELATGALLVFAADRDALALALLPYKNQALWRRTGGWLLLYGLTVPLAIGAMRGHEAGLILRDVVPFLFLLLPLALTDVSKGQRQRLAFTAVTGMVGIAFSVRLLLPAFAAAGRFGLSALPEVDPARFANAPTVLFAAIMAFAGAGGLLLRHWTWRRSIGAALLIGAGVCTVLAMIAASERASLGLLGLVLAGLWLWAFTARPLRALTLLVPLVLALLVFHGPIFDQVEHLVAKTASVGFNNRPQEAAVVFGLVSRDMAAALFGLGWGQTLADPAVGGATVNYTHTLGTALWLKTGLVGVVLTSLYLAGIAAGLVRLLPRHPALSAAIAAPLLIDVTLYASYKSLDFGLLLTLASMWGGLRGDDRRAIDKDDQPQPL